MKEELKGPQVENVAVAIVEEYGETNELEYNVYLINMRDEPLENVLINSKGYQKQENGELTKTSTLRHFVKVLPAQSFVKVEPIMKELFRLTNEYCVSFWIGEQLYDKKYIFLPDSVVFENFIDIPLMGQIGVYIK